MKILMVSMPSLHFFRWTSQLQDSGHEVYWFDITGAGAKADRINWVHQIVDCRLKYDYPGRYLLKSKMPTMYNRLQQFNEKDVAIEFEKQLLAIQPDVVHSFAMQLSCMPILSVMQGYPRLKWIYSSWGSDMFYFEALGMKEFQFKEVLKRVNYLITDCYRDFEIAKKNEYSNEFLGVFPGNGGIVCRESDILPVSQRKLILIKGYNDSIGKGMNIVKALTTDILIILKDFKIVVFGSSEEVQDYVYRNEKFKNVDIKVYLKTNFIDNNSLMKLMGESLIYIGNSISDGLPNALIEAMGMGAFPIQSNPGNVTEELINDKYNGLLIQDPLDITEISNHIKDVLFDTDLVEKAFHYNTRLIKENYDRKKIKNDIIKCYESVF